MRDPVRLLAPTTEAIREQGKLDGHLLGNPLACLARLQGVRIGEERRQNPECFAALRSGRSYVLVGECVDCGCRAVEVRMHLEAVHVADDRERRVLQVLAVELQLRVGIDQVFVPALVLPGKVSAQPHVRETLRTALGGAAAHHTALEGEEFAALVHIRGRGAPDQPADVYKMFLRPGPLLEPGVRPL